MIFYVNTVPKEEDRSYPFCLLSRNNWNDWGFLTTFSLKYYFQKNCNPLQVGLLKIGKINMEMPENYSKENRTPIDSNFTSLSEEYFSLGNSSEYYKQFYELGSTDKIAQEDILRSLRDVVFDSSIYDSNSNEPVMMNSLMRNSSIKTIKDVYYQVLSTGNENLTSYNFSLKLKNEINGIQCNS